MYMSTFICLQAMYIQGRAVNRGLKRRRRAHKKQSMIHRPTLYVKTKEYINIFTVFTYVVDVVAVLQIAWGVEGIWGLLVSWILVNFSLS
jgi:hypothetical protein